MSKFFAANSDSETSSSSSESEDEQGFQAGTQTAAFMFSDDEEDTKRVVRSAREKRYEQLTGIIKTVRNCKKINDFYMMETTFKDLQAAYDKARPVIDKEEGGVTPRFYVRILVEIEDLINDTWGNKDLRKSMNKNNSRSLGVLRQNLRKYIRNEFEEDVAKFRENPDQEDAADDRQDDEKAAKGSDDEEGSEGDGSGSEDDDEDGAAKGKGMSAASFLKGDSKKKVVDEEDDSDDSYWGSDDSSTESSSDEEPGDLKKIFLRKPGADDKAAGAGGLAPSSKKAEKGSKDKKVSRQAAKAAAASRAMAEDDDDADGDWTKVERTLEKPKMFSKDAEINHDVVVKKLAEFVAARGKKKTNRREQIELLTELLNVAKEHNLGAGIYVKIQFATVSSIFDNNTKTSAMKVEYWEKCMPAVEELLDMIEENVSKLTTGEFFTDDAESLVEAPYKVRGCVLSVVERLDDEFIKVLKSCDAHSHEYVDRLRDEPRILSILERAQKLVEKNGVASEKCRIYMKRIEHLYFKFDQKVVKHKEGEGVKDEETSLQVMEKLCKFIYSNDATDRLRTRAILCHVYHHAIHDNWFDARDMMLMSHLQDSITHSDPSTQILYNRTMVQLGLCGFRHAEIRDAHNALLDIHLGGRSKELLAQGLLLQKHQERSLEQEKIERQRQMPFHMHINLEQLECVYLVSAMLLEVPYMAAHEYDARRRMISKYYYHQLRSNEQQALVGPPELMREHVVAASKAMKNGDWRRCRDLIINEKMNAKVWDLFYNADKVRQMLVAKIQEETLRTYLFTFSRVYDSISVLALSEMFDLKKEAVHAIVSKMILNEELMASMDEPTQCVVMHKTEPSRLQSLSLQLADKVAQLVENNERLLDMRPGWQNNWRGQSNRQDGGRGGGMGGGGGMFRNRDNQGGGGNFGRRDNQGGGGGNFGRRDNQGGGGGGFGRRGGDNQGGGGGFGRRGGGDRNNKFGNNDRRFDRNSDRGGDGGRQHHHHQGQR